MPLPKPPAARASVLPATAYETQAAPKSARHRPQVAATVADIGFTLWAPGGGSDLTLTPASPFKKGASDGTDPGADVAQVTSRIEGVAYTPAVP